MNCLVQSLEYNKVAAQVSIAVHGSDLVLQGFAPAVHLPAPYRQEVSMTRCRYHDLS